MTKLGIRPVLPGHIGPAVKADEVAALVPVLLFVLGMGLLPLAFLFAEATRSLGGGYGLASVVFGPTIQGAVARQALQNSTVQGGFSALLAFAWGYPVGVFLGRHRFRGREAVVGFLLVPFLLPALVVVVGLRDLVGPGGLLPLLGLPTSGLSSGLAAIVLANVYYNSSMVALFTIAAIESASPRLEEAVATLGGGPWRAFRDVWGRGSLLGGIVGALLTFLLSFLGFAAPLLLGGPSNFTVEVWIYALAHSVYASPVWAAGLAFWTVLLLAIPTGLYLYLARLARLRGSRVRSIPRLVPIKWRSPTTWSFLILGGALLGFLASLLGIVVALAFRLPGGGWGTGNWALLFSDRVTSGLGISTLGALTNTLFFAGASTALVLGLVLLTAYARRRSELAGGPVDGLVLLPLLLSPVILAFALRGFWGSTLGTSADLWMLIVASQAALALPFVLQTVTIDLRAHSPVPRAAAETLGATPWKAFRDVDVPALRGALVAGSLFAFALSLGEFAATNFLYIPSYTTLVVEMYVLGLLRLTGAVQALGALLVIVSLVSLLVLSTGGRRVRF